MQLLLHDGPLKKMPVVKNLILILFHLKHQEQIRDENKKMAASLVSTKTAATVIVLPVTSTSTVTASTSTVTSATADVNPTSSNSSLISQAGSDSSLPKSQGTGPSGKSNGGPGSQLASGTQTGRRDFKQKKTRIKCTLLTDNIYPFWCEFLALTSGDCLAIKVKLSRINVCNHSCQQG